MSGLVWCCCSAGRPDLLVRKTLATLARGHFDGLLWVVVPTDEVVAYQNALRGQSVRTALIHTDRGLVKQRRFFRDQMLPGTEIVFIDDDVEAIKIRTTGGIDHCRALPLLAHFVFQAMAARGPDCLLAGVYPVANRDWMRPSVTVGNAYIVGALYFCKNDQRLEEPDQDECEDWARCLSEQAAGRDVLRFNWIGIQTQYWKNPGGMQSTRDEATRTQRIHQLCEAYPGIVQSRLRRNGHLDLKCRAKPVGWDGHGVPTSSPVAPQPSDASGSDAALPPESSAPPCPSD